MLAGFAFLSVSYSVFGELYAVKAGVVCLQVKLCDLHLSALEVRFSRRGAIQIYVYVYLYIFNNLQHRA